IDVASSNVWTSWDYNYTLKHTSDANSVWLFGGLSLDRLSGPAGRPNIHRSVSKQWKSFVDSSGFIPCYEDRRSQPHHLLLRYKEANEVKYVSFLDDVTFPQQQQDFALNVPLLLSNLNIQK
nr:hypothetical protein [Tanacetum cinerariifolium]